VLKQSGSLGILALPLAPAGSPHCITSIQAGSMIARDGSALVGEFITHIDTIPTDTMNHCELHRALHGPEYTSVSLDVADLQGNAQTISVLRSPVADEQKAALKKAAGVSGGKKVKCD